MRHPSRVLKLALALSLVLHLVLLWWWQRIPLPPAQPPPSAHSTQDPVEVLVVDVPPAPPPAPAPPSQGPEPREREAGRKGNRPRTGPPAASPSPAPAPLASDVPRVEEAPEKPSLLPDTGTLALQPGGDFPVLPPDEPGPPGTRLRAPAHPASPQELVSQTARDTVARRRAESGLTHSYFGDMGKVLARRFRQSHADVEEGRTTKEKVAQKARDVSSVLSRSGEMEDPLAHPRRVDPLASGPASHPMLKEAQESLAYSLPNKWTHSEGVAVVRLTQDAGGKVRSVEIIEPSGNGGLDQAAVTAVTELGEELPSLPPEVLMGRDSVVSEWRFELLRTVGGPGAKGVGVVGTFDPVTGVEDALPTFAARSKVRVTLVAYY